MARDDRSFAVVAIEKRSALGFVQAVFDAHARGAVTLALDPDAEPPAGLIAAERIAVAPGGGWFERRVEPRHDDAPAQISLTSGTTGMPKAILLSHRALGDVTRRLVDVMALDGSIREYVGVPVTFSFGFGRVRAIAAVGGASYLPERGFRVDELAAMLARGEVNALSAVPALLRSILAQRSRFADVGSKLRWLEIGSQQMSGEEKRAVRALFPNARIVQHYGLTEASRSTFLVVSEAPDDVLDSVGKPYGDVALRIEPDGRVAISGPHVADGVVSDAGVEPLADPHGWLVTNDLGRLVDDHLFYDGRADHLINVAGIKVPAELFEERLVAVLGHDADVAVAAGADPIRGQIVVVAHPDTLEPGSIETLARASAEVAAEMHVPDGVALLPMPAIPRTETAKVRRGAISDAYAAERPLSAPSVAVAPAEDPGAGVEAVFAEAFGAAGRDHGASFESLGGDSLRYVNTLLALETHVRQLPEDWDTISIGALATLAREQVAADRTASRGRFLPSNLDTVRGLACVLIVALHVVGVAPDEGLKLPESSTWHDVMRSLNLVRLPLFTALAGFLYAAMPATRSGWSAFMGRKLSQLAAPLIFATFAFWALRKVTYDTDDSLLWAYVDGYLHLWYIEALLVMFAIASFVDVLARGRVWPFALIVAAVFAGFWAVPDIPVAHARNALFLLPFFIGGTMLYRHSDLLRQKPVVIACLALMLVSVGLEYADWTPHPIVEQAAWLKWLCGAASVVALLGLFPRMGWLEWLAAYSFTIYLWHPAASATVRTVLGKLGLESIPALFVIGLAAGIGVPILIHVVAIRFPKIVRAPVIGV